MVESNSNFDRQQANYGFALKACGVTFLAICVLGITIPMVWAVRSQPKTESPELRVDSVFTSAFNLTGPDFSGDWNVGFTVTVPNEKRDTTLSYDTVACSVFYNIHLLGKKYQKLALVLGAGNHQTAVNASVVAESTFIDEWTWVHMMSERSRGRVRFNVAFDAYGVDDSACFTCRDLVVNFGSTNSGVGELVGGSTKCNPSSCPDQYSMWLDTLD